MGNKRVLLLVALCLLLAGIGMAPSSKAMAGDVFMEWDIPTPNSQPHDLQVDPDGIAWFTEIAANKIGRFDLNTEEFIERTLPTPGGNPHGIAVGPDNAMWFTEQGGNKIGRIDRTTLAITEFPIQGTGPHTPIYDGNGHLWFTEQSGNRIGRLDIATGQIQETAIPREIGTGPYGIVADQAGNGWFCVFGPGSNNIARIDAKTLEFTPYATKTVNSGPRRLWFDSKGILWITLNRAGKLARFDPSTEEFTEWDSPGGANSQPYAITVDLYDKVWYTEFQGNQMIKYDPDTDEFTAYEFPTLRNQARFISVDADNRVWYPNNGNSAIGVLVEQ